MAAHRKPNVTGLSLQHEMSKLPAETRMLANVAEAGSIEAVLIDDLKTDPDYQRALNHLLIQSIARDFKPKVAGVILVSRRGNGDLYIIDGQQRAAGAKLAGESHILALVLTGLGKVTEAQMRLAANVKRADSASEKFRAKLAAKDKQAVAIVALLEDYAVELNLQSNSLERGLNAVSTVERLYAIDDGAALRATLDAIVAAWGIPEGRNATAPILLGVRWFLKVHPDADLARLAERMAAIGPAALARRALTTAAAMGGTHWLNTYRALVEVYNERLSESQRLQWITKGSAKLNEAGKLGQRPWE